MAYKIELTDILVKYIELEASSKEEALEKVKDVCLDSEPKKNGGDRVKRKVRVFNHFTFIAKYESKSDKTKEMFLTKTPSGLSLSIRGTEFENIEECKRTMLEYDSDKKNWKVIRLKRL